MTEAPLLLARAEELLLARRIEEALLAFDRAEQAGADRDRCGGARWRAAMLTGEFGQAWEESDALRARDTPDPHRFWKGESMQGKRVIVRCLHGFGDAVQMLRYAPSLARIAESVVYEVAPRFVDLARYVNGVEQVVTWGDNTPANPPAWDHQLEVMELPYIFRTTRTDLPMATHYLKLPESERERAGRCMGVADRPRIGVVWAAGEWNRERSISLSLLEPLLVLDGFEFWNLQGGTAASEGDATPMGNATAICGDGLLPLAATIANLDLVITVDTLAAHLAGAMGKPAWVMLQYAADWRWMLACEDSPWYPTLRLFRQSSAGDWPGVVAAVQLAVREQWK